MKTLGISEEHDSGAALISAGKILFASNEERYVGKKFFYGFPHRSLEWISSQPQSSNKKKSHVAIASKFHVSESLGSWMNMPAHLQALENTLHSVGLDRALWGTKVGPWLLNSLSAFSNIFRKRRILKNLYRLGWDVSSCSFIDHHLCHASAAYHTSGWNTCLVVTLDASGDGYCSKVFIASEGKLTEVHSIPFFHSPGHYYEYVTLILGFKIGREGKVTGLAAHGDSTKTSHIFFNLHVYDKVKHRFQNNGPYRSAAIRLLKKRLAQYSREDIAAGVQNHLEQTVSAYIQDIISLYGQGEKVKIAVAGGVFANVKLNQVISKIDDVEELFVYPHMGDGGLAVGAALYSSTQTLRRFHVMPQITSSYFSDDITQTQCIEAVAQYHNQITCTSPKNFAHTIAKYLSQSKTVAIVQGKMEYGPRALGHRSILYQATDPTVSNWLNKKLNRSDFMPFAPILKREHISEFFTGWEKLTQPIRFMTTTLDCNKRCMKEAPAIVHKDGTARPQAVTHSQQPLIFEILSEYTRITKLKVLINTSFNMHESPIVRTAEDAIKTFLASELDYLVLNTMIVQRKSALQ